MAVGVFILFFLWQPIPPPAAPIPPPAGTPVPAVDIGRLTPARVTYVVDGDTIEVALDGRTYRLRYIGMDTPERDERFYRESTNRNRQLVGGQTVYLEKDVSETDRYGRLLRYVYLADGRMVNELLVHEGLAQAATFPPDVRHADRFRAAQRAAQRAERGMWGG
jgi:micrococcal nuclease